jgi:hypothetical protein
VITLVRCYGVFVFFICFIWAPHAREREREIFQNERIKPWAGCTLKFKLEAVRRIKVGQVAAVTAKILGILHSEADALSGDK